ncbi:hypothetical protein CY35_12G079700 [Sphagnum magellanicum]|nr:hypothetical protein CY35_12G079700 [Sphagnum magellanicum]KAH9546132.1 hypothetical protein CY35_12G079700 [Sphagnum magellanicum]KAH9546133.1 hypothetical protein CY35_12G079700 [Sphagnum magellanicum]
MKLRLESARRVQDAWRLSMLAHSFHPTGGYCRHAAHSRTVSSSDVQLNKQIWGAAGHYFGSFSLPRTQDGNVLFTPTRRFHTEPHMWRLISRQGMSIELPLALRTRRSVADGIIVGTISMKVGRATLRTQARVVTEAGKAEVSRGAKLAMEIRRLGENKSQAMLMYLVAMVAAMVGITYAAVPLYRKFCQATGYGGTIQRREIASCRRWRRKLLATRLKNLQVFENWWCNLMLMLQMECPGNSPLPNVRQGFTSTRSNAFVLRSNGFFLVKKSICQYFSTLILNLLQTLRWTTSTP